MGLIRIIERIAGTTLKQTLVSSGATMSPISFQLLSGSETLVHSTAGVSSGDGHYYALQPLPTSHAWYIGQAIAVINANTYISRQIVKALALEVE